MKNRQIQAMTALVVVALIMLAGCQPKQPAIVKAKQIPLEDFFKNPEKAGYQLSPGGTYFSFTAPYMDRMNIFVQEIGADSATRLTSETDRDINGYFWPNDNQILYLKDQGGDENFRLYGINVDGTNPVCYTPFDGVRTDIIDDLPDFPDLVIIGMNKRNPQVFDPYRLNLKTGEMEMLAENPGNIQSWVFDHDGKLRVATAIVDGINSQLLYRETEKDAFVPVLTTSFKESMSPAFFTFDNQNIYAISNLNRDKTAAVIFDIRNGKEIEVLYENSEYDVDNIFYSKKRKVITTANYYSDKRNRHFFDEDTRLLIDRLKKDLGQYELGISSVTKEEDKMIVRTYSDKSLGAYYLYDKTTDKLTKIADISPWLDEKEMADMLPVTYQSRDGLTIHGYLTLPKGYTMETAKKLPPRGAVPCKPWICCVPNELQGIDRLRQELLGSFLQAVGPEYAE
jgi:dipeptidyl aminopeptidase/acylaminoacyl peptidase